MLKARLPKRSRKAGLAPGSLIHIGDRRLDRVILNSLAYNSEATEERLDTSLDTCIALSGEMAGCVQWLNVAGVHDTRFIQRLGERFGIHPLALEDILDTTQRPKLDEYEDHLLLVVKMIYLTPEKHIVIEQVSLIIKDGLVISFQEDDTDIFEPLRQRMHTAKWRQNERKADYLAYALLDTLVDDYFKVIEHLDTLLETLESALLRDRTPSDLDRMQQLMQDIQRLKRTLSPMREVLKAVQMTSSPLINNELFNYFDDIRDHLVDSLDTLDTQKSQLESIESRYISLTSHKMNQTMQLLTIYSTIFLPLTFLTGVYGMNFRVMPELEWQGSYFVLWGIMISVAVVMLGFFKRKNML